jgi:hypothetical protein
VTWLRFGLWLAVGLVIYAVHGRTYSRLQRGEGPDTAPERAAIRDSRARPAPCSGGRERGGMTAQLGWLRSFL